MKKIYKNIIIIIFSFLVVALVSCNKNTQNGETNPDPVDPETVYAPTNHNLDLRAFALTVSEAVSSNKSFRKLIKTEANKMFDGDFDVLLSHVVDAKVENYEVNENGTATRASGEISVRDLLNSSFRRVKEKRIIQGDMSLAERYNTRDASLIDQLIGQYPDLQIAVPFLIEQLEDENYIPPVVFLSEEYDEGETEYLFAVKQDDVYAQQAKVQPGNAHIVIGICERTLDGILLGNLGDTVVPPTPTSLQIAEMADGIKLEWDMPAGTSYTNTLGYKIYRAAGSSGFGNEPYAVVQGYANIFFTDRNAPHSVTYYYRVSAFNNCHESGLSNLKSITPSRPAAATSFTVEQEALNLVKLAWTFAGNEYYGNVNLYKRFIGTTTTIPFASYPVSADNCFDVNVEPGTRIEYKIERSSAYGASVPKYDFIYTPHRDMNEYSRVVIDKITFSDVWAIEGWNGAPEFEIKVLGILGNTTTDLHTFQINGPPFSNLWVPVGLTVTNYWRPWKTDWYDAYSFYIVEKDGGVVWEELMLFAQKVGKAAVSATGATGAGPWLEPLDVLGKLLNKWIRTADDKVGYAYLNYYDDTYTTYVTNSAEKSGNFIIQFKP